MYLGGAFSKISGDADRTSPTAFATRLSLKMNFSLISDYHSAEIAPRMVIKDSRAALMNSAMLQYK